MIMKGDYSLAYKNLKKSLILDPDKFYCLPHQAFLPFHDIINVSSSSKHFEYRCNLNSKGPRCTILYAEPTVHVRGSHMYTPS